MFPSCFHLPLHHIQLGEAQPSTGNNRGFSLSAVPGEVMQRFHCGQELEADEPFRANTNRIYLRFVFGSPMVKFNPALTLHLFSVERFCAQQERSDRNIFSSKIPKQFHLATRSRTGLSLISGRRMIVTHVRRDINHIFRVYTAENSRGQAVCEDEDVLEL